MLRILNISLTLLGLWSIGPFALSQSLKTEKVSGSKVWIDPSINPNAGTQSIVVWFDQQFLGKGDSFKKKTLEFKGEKRSTLSQRVIQTLKKISARSNSVVKKDIDQLIKNGHLTNLQTHWIVNGFSAQVDAEGLATIQKLTGVSKIFKKRTAFAPTRQNYGPEYLKTIPTSRFEIGKAGSFPWNIQRIKAPEVWKEFGVTGKGTLNVVHDFGFKLDIPPLAETIYTNSGEIPGNGMTMTIMDWWMITMVSTLMLEMPT